MNVEDTEVEHFHRVGKYRQTAVRLIYKVEQKIPLLCADKDRGDFVELKYDKLIIKPKRN